MRLARDGADGAHEIGRPLLGDVPGLQVFELAQPVTTLIREVLLTDGEETRVPQLVEQYGCDVDHPFPVVWSVVATTSYAG